MQRHLEEISSQVHTSAHALLLLDQAGWHITDDLTIPDNITLVPIPPRSPELNPVENIWQYMRDNWLSNIVFQSEEEIVDCCCEAWNKLINKPGKIKGSIRELYALVIECLERQEVGLWTARVSRCGFRRRAG